MLLSHCFCCPKCNFLIWVRNLRLSAAARYMAILAEYSKEDRDMLDGADDSTVTYELTPLKKGLFDIYEVEGFRCQEAARKKHTIVVI